MTKEYKLQKISDLLKVPADKRDACLEEIGFALDLHELTYGDDAENIPFESIVWKDDGNSSVSIKDADGEVLLERLKKFTIR